MNLQQQSFKTGLFEIGLPPFLPRSYAHRLYKNYRYTDNVRELLCERGRSWVIERIFAAQEQLSAHGVRSVMQYWEVAGLDDGSVQLCCRAGRAGDIIFYEHIDRPVCNPGDLKLVFYRDVLNVR